MRPDIYVDTDIASLGGMSGGAVCNAEGSMFGMVSAGLDAHGELEARTAVSMIWRALGITFKPAWPYSNSETTGQLWQFIPDFGQADLLQHKFNSFT